MKITLVRHGKPKASCNPRVNAVGFAKWVRAYNHSYVHSSSQPPDELCNKIKGRYAISSDLNRAKHSAELCIGKAPDLVLREMREMDIPRFKIPFSTSVNNWLLISRVCWLLGISGRSEPLHVGRRRVLVAVDLILEQVKNNDDVVVFGHALINRFIVKELKKRGWSLEQQSKGFWGTTELINI